MTPITPSANKLKHFDLDLQFGKAGEEWLKLLLVDSAKVEVKRDAQAVRSGSFLLETQCNGVDSGINTTHADFWAVVIDVNGKPGGVLVFDTPNMLRNLTRLIHGGQVTKRHGIGDGGRVSGYDVPLTLIEELFQP